MESWKDFEEKFKREKIPFLSDSGHVAIVISKTGRKYVVSDYEISGKNVKFLYLFFEGKKVGRLRLQDIESVS